MRVTVLGKSPAWQDAGGACSAYLVVTDAITILLECGNGSFGKLRQYHDYTEVDAVVVSHMHADHFFDVVSYAFALLYSPRQQPVPIARWPGTDKPARPKLYLPPGGITQLNKITTGLDAPGLVERAFDAVEYDPAKSLRLGDLDLRFQPVPHYVATNAIEFTKSDGKRFVFGADCRPCEEIIEFGRDADLMMLEATLPRPERTGIRGHMTAAEAGEHGARAGARRLVLTHYPDELDKLWVENEAQRSFGGQVTLAEEGHSYAV